MMTFGLKLKRQSALPPRVAEIKDPLEVPSKLPSITDYIEKLIDASPELMKAPHEDEFENESGRSKIPPPDRGMVFISQPSQVRNDNCTVIVLILM